MNIHFCPKSAAAGVLFGALCVVALWYADTLAGRATITQALLAGARCDESGFVSITFADASQFTCVPQAQMPPTSRAEAERRRKAGQS